MFGFYWQISDTVHLGKDRPFVLRHDEAAWKGNRHGYFVITAP